MIIVKSHSNLKNAKLIKSHKAKLFQSVQYIRLSNARDPKILPKVLPNVLHGCGKFERNAAFWIFSFSFGIGKYLWEI